jgi:hypothetical protein
VNSRSDIPSASAAGTTSHCRTHSAVSRASGHRRLGRLARQRVADYLVSDGLPATAQALRLSPPSVLPAFMAVLGIEDSVLGGIRMPDDRRNGADADNLIAAALAEHGGRAGISRARVADFLATAGMPETAAAVRISPTTMMKALVAAFGVPESALNGAELAAPVPSAATPALIAAGRREAGRVARRRVAAVLTGAGLLDTARAVQESEPNVLLPFVAAMGLDKRMLVGLPLQASTFAGAATMLVNTARAERARHSQAANGSAARRIAVADPRTAAGAQCLAARPKRLVAAPLPNCRKRPEVLLKWEQVAEETFDTGTREQARAARVEAEMFCKGCPLSEMCAETANSTGYTGLAGGRIFVDGRRRANPSHPVRIVA